MKRGEYSVSFLVQPNAITRENIPLLLILDALKLLREIPATSPDDCVRGVARLIAALSEGDLEKLADLAEKLPAVCPGIAGCHSGQSWS